MGLLMASTVGVPTLAMILLAIVESMAPVSPWQQVKRVGHDLCILSIGIAGSMFGNVRLQGHIDLGHAAVVSIVVVLVNLILAAVVILVDSRCSTCTDRGKGSLSIFLGVVTVAIPSGVMIYVARLS
jgi:hypothetical protein